MNVFNKSLIFRQSAVEEVHGSLHSVGPVILVRNFSTYLATSIDLVLSKKKWAFLWRSWSNCTVEGFKAGGIIYWLSFQVDLPRRLFQKSKILWYAYLKKENSNPTCEQRPSFSIALLPLLSSSSFLLVFSSLLSHLLSSFVSSPRSYLPLFFSCPFLSSRPFAPLSLP